MTEANLLNRDIIDFEGVLCKIDGGSGDEHGDDEHQDGEEDGHCDGDLSGARSYDESKHQ